MVAIDNVHFDGCTLPPKKDSCNSDTEFRCGKFGFCISKDALCDFVDDCGDKSDESAVSCQGFGSLCNFELSEKYCGIRDESLSKVHWRIYSPSLNLRFQAASDYEPKFDHTFRTSSGNYYLLDPGFALTSPNGTFSSQMVQSKDNSLCKIRFFYFMNDRSEGFGKAKIILQTRFASKTTPEDTILETIIATKELQQRWVKKVIALPNTSPFHVLFTGVFATINTRIAIDDITFDSSCSFSDVLPKQVTTVGPSSDEPTTQTMLPSSENPATKPTQPEEITTTEKPHLDNKQNSPGHGVLIAVGTTIPILVVLTALGVFLWYKKQSGNSRSEDRINFSLNRLSKKYT